MSVGQDRRDSMDATPLRSQLADELARWRRSLELDLRVAAPAHVVTYNAAAETVDVLLGALPVAYIEGEEIPQPPIAIPGVPIEWMGTARGGVTVGLLPGDTGVVLFTDRCLQTWHQAAIPGAPVDPISGRTHALGDAVFRPGLRQLTAPPRAVPVDPVATVVEGPTVKLGAGATEFGMLGTSLAATSATLHSVLVAVPVASDPATVITLANANQVALLGILAAIQTSVSVKVQVQ